MNKIFTQGHLRIRTGLYIRVGPSIRIKSQAFENRKILTNFNTRTSPYVRRKTVDKNKAR